MRRRGSALDTDCDLSGGEPKHMKRIVQSYTGLVVPVALLTTVALWWHSKSTHSAPSHTATTWQRCTNRFAGGGHSVRYSDLIGCTPMIDLTALVSPKVAGWLKWLQRCPHTVHTCCHDSTSLTCEYTCCHMCELSPFVNYTNR